MIFRLYFAREEHKNAGYPNFLTYIYDRKQEKQKEIKNMADFFIEDFINTDLFFEWLKI